MDLSVNLTLVVQVANFLVAYILINKIFLRHGYASVKADRDRERQLKSNIVARQELIAHKQLYKADRWKLFQDYFYKQKPADVREYAAPEPVKEREVTSLSADQLAQLSKEISRAIKPLVTK